MAVRTQLLPLQLLLLIQEEGREEEGEEEEGVVAIVGTPGGGILGGRTDEVQELREERVAVRIDK